MACVHSFYTEDTVVDLYLTQSVPHHSRHKWVGSQQNSVGTLLGHNTSCRTYTSGILHLIPGLTAQLHMRKHTRQVCFAVYVYYEQTTFWPNTLTATCYILRTELLSLYSLHAVGIANNDRWSRL